MRSDREIVIAVYHEWEAITDKMLSLSYDAMTATELLNLQSRRDVVSRALPAADHQIIALLAAHADPKALGAKNLADLLRISVADANQRIKDAKLLGPTDFRKAADRLALLLDQDGDPPDHAEQARRRYLTIDKPGPNGLSRIHGLLDPEAVATLEPGLATLGAPGRCKPRRPHALHRRPTRRRHHPPQHPPPGPTPPRRAQSHGSCGVGVGQAGPPQRAARHHHRDHHPRPASRPLESASPPAARSYRCAR